MKTFATLLLPLLVATAMACSSSPGGTGGPGSDAGTVPDRPAEAAAAELGAGADVGGAEVHVDAPADGPAVDGPGAADGPAQLIDVKPADSGKDLANGAEAPRSDGGAQDQTMLDTGAAVCGELYTDGTPTGGIRCCSGHDKRDAGPCCFCPVGQCLIEGSTGRTGCRRLF